MTGHLDTVMGYIARHYREETDRRIDLLLKKLEGTGVCIEDEIATADKFDPQYLSKIVD